MQGTSIGVHSRDLNDLIGKLKHGLPVGSFDRLRERLDLPEKMLASTINIAYRTLSRRKKEGRFKTDESEHADDAFAGEGARRGGGRWNS